MSDETPSVNQPAAPVQAATAPVVHDMWAPVGPALWNEVQAPRLEKNQTAWLLTCVDLTSLLLCFFVLLFSTQSLERDQWQALTESFQAQFSTQNVIVPLIPDGGSNAVVRVTPVKSGLAYLDSLLQQRIDADPVWKGMVPKDRNASELLYPIPAGVDDAAWGRIGGVLRGWKNPVGIVMVAAEGDLTAATQKAVAMTDKLAKSGVMTAFADIRVQKDLDVSRVYLAVRGQ